jgi:arylsulfatase A-like enzyme/Flp pilus assembly protein TadD
MVQRRSTSRLLALLLALGSLATAVAMVLRSQPGREREAGRNVLLLTIDTLRADALGAYGRADAATPWIDRLAAAGVRFVDAHAHNVTTLASHANILSGRLPTEHGVRDNACFRFPSGTETLATQLKAHGYRTAAFVSAFPLDSRFGLARGFDVYDDRFVDAQARPVLLEQERRGEATVALAKAWIEAKDEAPWFCWVHVYEPHAPYAPPEPFAARFPGRPYDGEVATADAALRPLLEPILAAGRAGRTVVVMTADHGESLGEHGEATHGIFAYEATLRVPLLFYSPGLARPRVVDAPARHVDLLPTILDALALPVPAGLPGRSLLDAAAGRSAPDVPTYFEALSGQLNRGWAPLHGVIEGRKKLVELPIPELYDLASDPAEARNLAASSPEPLERLRARLSGLRAREAEAGAAPSREDEATLERLRSLGYLGAGASPRKQRYDENDDPKTLVPVDAALQDVVALFSSGKKREALERCRALVRERPGLPLALVYLGQLERESGDVADSVDALRRALALNPEDTVTATLLAADLTQSGKPREALALLEPWAARAEPDLDVLPTSALAAARLGRTAEAERTLVKALALDPSSARVLVGLGSVRLTAGEREKARQAFEQALARNPSAAQAESALAMMAAEDGRADEARERFSRALAADPGEAAKLLALASMLASRGRMGEARGYLELFEQKAEPSLFARELEQVRVALGRGGAAAAQPR